MAFLRWIGTHSRIILTAIWIFFFLLAVLAPLLVEILPPVSFLCYSILKPLCHQAPERSFFLAGYKMGLCTRCTGIFGALAVFSILTLILNPRKGLPFWLFLILLAPMAIDGTAQVMGLWKTPNVPRFFTGILAGFAIVFWIYPFIFELEKEIKHKKVPENNPERGAI